MSMSSILLILLFIGLFAIIASAVQLYDKGGIDKDKLEEVFAEDATFVREKSVSLFARIKKLFHKG